MAAELLIIEGIDRIGKSTLIENKIKEFEKVDDLSIVNYHDYDGSFDPISINGSIYCPVFNEMQFANLSQVIIGLNAVKKEAMKHKDHVLIIADRMHLSEYAYGWNKRRYAFLKTFQSEVGYQEYINAFERSLESIFDLVSLRVFFTQEMPRHDDDRDKDLDRFSLANINQSFTTAFDMSSIEDKKLIPLCYDDNDLTNILAKQI